MQEVISSNKDLLDVLIQVLIIVIPVVITWLIWTCVRSSSAARDIATIARLSNAAIDYAEDLDKRGDLDLSPQDNKGVRKLNLAGKWLEGELRRAGIKRTEEEAQKWIASQFQRQVGSVRMVDTITQLTRAAVDLVQDLERSGAVEPLPGIDRIAYLAELAADWVIAGLAKRGASIPREEALAWVRAGLVQRLRAEGSPPGDPLGESSE